MMKRLVLLLVGVLAVLAIVPATAGAKTLSSGMCGRAVHRLQKRLVKRTYLPRGYTPGCYDYRTEQAVMAFQGWARLTRDGVAGTTTKRRLRNAVTPHPWTGDRHFRHLEVHKKRQVLLVVGRLGKVQRAIHVSTAAPGHVTPDGHWKVYSKSPMSWSHEFHVWLPWASYIVGGIALHSFDSVPPYPASHGCIRMPAPEARWVYDKAPIGTPVWVK
jgi:L,D-transpeptidase-like protein/putative peptidoglycan binding protein